MAIASTVIEYLEARGLRYRTVVHQPEPTSSQTAEAAHVPGDHLAKAVLVRSVSDHGDSYLVAVLPATQRLELGTLRRRLGHMCALADRDAVRRWFPDCAEHAVPACAQAYGLPVLLDESLLEQDPVYLEVGDRARLIEMSGSEFRKLMRGSDAGLPE
ncbi:MAG: YbaK/EbsC family protein [Pseudomonadales bacterium]|jgi:Ala-tRNA(Pro) deacylase